MKNVFKLLTVVSISLFVMSCGGDECKTCDVTDPIFGLEFTTEACDNGDGTITISSLGQDTIVSQSLDDYVREIESFPNSSCE